MNTFFKRLLGITSNVHTPTEVKGVKSKKIIPPPQGRPSVKNEIDSKYSMLTTGKRLVPPSFDLEMIPLIRHLSKYNADLGQAVFDLVNLANTGITINFDLGVKEKQAVEMRRHLESVSKNWHVGCAGLRGLATKMFSQIWIAGAISNEWVPRKDLKGVSGLTFLNPENVRWVYRAGRYHPYQRLKNATKTDLHPLNPNTFRYYAINGDEDAPYGIPPFLTAISPIETQGTMVENIKFMVDLLGLMGYTDALIDKPMQMDNESDAEYTARLTKLLSDMKERVQSGMRDGVNVGFKEDHEFNFNSTTKDTQGVSPIWELNEQQVASGLKYDSAFLGRAYGSNESSITILFTKMISTLSLIQKTVAENLEYGLAMELTMAGFKYKTITVEFHKSTITDNLKHQQAEEYKIRNNRQLAMDGIIDQAQYATNMGYDKPAKDKPVVPYDAGKSAYDGEIQRRKEKGDKQDAEKKTRDKRNPQGTIKKQK